MRGKTRDILLEHYMLAFAVTLVVMVVSILVGGGRVIVPILALAAIEITFSFENAVINSEVLSGMHRFWRVMFLTVGIAVAVFGVRLLLPLVLVGVTSGHPVSYVLNTALHNPTAYAQELQAAYPIIAAFGGVFLLMVGLRFFGERRDVMWLNGVEAPLGEFNQPWRITLIGGAASIAAIYFVLAPGDVHIALAGLCGALTFVAVKVISNLLVGRSRSTLAHGFTMFLYLELLDASFSFDSVIAAFAITKEVLLIAAGLGIGAVYVRSMTIHLLKEGTLGHYRYLIHGAHYAIIALSILLMASIAHEIPEYITGLLGMAILAAAFESSRRHNHRANS